MVFLLNMMILQSYVKLPEGTKQSLANWNAYNYQNDQITITQTWRTLINHTNEISIEWDGIEGETPSCKLVSTSTRC